MSPMASRVRSLTAAACLGAALLASAAEAQQVRKGLWAHNGAVFAMAIANNILYLGGTFTEVGPVISATVALDGTTGAPLPTFPCLTAPLSGPPAQVRAVAADGSGGWYIGGYFNA